MRLPIVVGHARAMEMIITGRRVGVSMFMRRDSHTHGAAAFKSGKLEPAWPNHGL